MKKSLLVLLCALAVGTMLEARGGRGGGGRGGRRGFHHGGGRHHGGWHRGRRYHGRGWGRGWGWGWGPSVSFVAPVTTAPVTTPADFQAQFGYYPSKREFCNWVGWGTRSCRLY